MNIFKAVKDKLFGDIKNKAVAMAKDFGAEILTAAKLLDLDANGVKDIAQIQNDLGAIVSHAQAGVSSFAKIAAPAADLAKLGGLYYLKFGPKKPSVVAAALAAPADNTEVA